MKLEKKHWITIAVIVAIIIIWYCFFRKKKAESAYTRGTKAGKGIMITNPSARGYRGDYNMDGVVNAEENNWFFWNKPLDIKPAGAGCVNCWVSSVEDGTEYCRWYDNYGRNTQTYAGRGCTKTQAGMGGVNQGYGADYGKKRKPWWAVLFGA